MTTPAERAVIEAARKQEWAGRVPSTTSYYVDCLVGETNAAVRVLIAAPPQPDLDALNAAVAEAVERHAKAHADDYVPGKYPWSREWNDVADALLARREALKPKARYTANDGIVRDTRTGEYLSTYDCADLLNEKEKP